ncbi:anaphase-promoting complex subunit 3 [Nematocida sp. ERTm5]|nr:anaphase-promoting complex subunit 3 [Nematocida sp. AWRm79]KAI5185176.1 anaphase-promoting complex subunit 3 [Nematocida sp. AWRm78]OAG30657.1 anaphase-promoting complex subunit 3 [Nematocida sp. ERTm5]
MHRVEEFLCKCIQYERFKDAVYIVECLSIDQQKDRSLLLGYLFMRNSEYRRALQYLCKDDTCTSLYYQALCHRHLKEYTKVKYIAVELLEKIKTREPSRRCTPLENMYVLEMDRTFVLALLAEAETETGCPDMGLKRCIESAAAGSLLYSVYRPMLEESTKVARRQERVDENRSNEETTDSKKSSLEESTKIERKIMARLEKETGKSTECIIRNIAQECSLLKNISMGILSSVSSYISLFNQMPIYSIASIAVHIFECGYMQKAGTVFEYIRVRDSYYIDTMHYYSSILWHNRDKGLLTSLSRDIFGVNPASNISWAVLGNHFSLKKETEKALECFERSLAISKDPYVLCLLGHEQFMNSNLTESLKCFIESMKIKSENYSGIAGCGLIYEKIGKKESAEYCFTRAIATNPQNILLAYLAVKYFVSQVKLSSAYSLLQKYLHIKEGIESVAAKVQSDSKWVEKIYAQASTNEQTASLVGSFLLELSYILVHSGHMQSGEKLAKESTGKGQYFQTRKNILFDIISNIASGNTSATL